MGMLAVLLALAAAQISPDLQRLVKIKTLMADNLTRLPNYTCLVTTERFHRKSAHGTFEYSDTVRLEVAQAENKELLGWPGSPLEERNIRSMVPEGLIGTGDFALHARSIFRTNVPLFRYVGPEELNGRKAVRFDYRVDLLVSGYELAYGNNRAVVPYHGSFWADERTNELMRLTVDADDVPPNVGRRAFTILDYAKARIGDGDFLLPQEAELTFEGPGGFTDRNRIHFTNCRQYQTESAIHFENADSTIRYEVAPPPVETTLPGDLALHLRIETTLDSRKAAGGDPIDARLTKDVRSKGETLASAGAVVHGRIIRVAKRPGRLEAYVMDLEFFEIVQEHAIARFRGRIEYVAPVNNLRLVQTVPNQLNLLGSSFKLAKLDLTVRTSAPKP